MSRRMDDGGDGGARMAVPWRKAWWRSVGFWLGLWGLAFVGWVWKDSYSHGSHVGVTQMVTHARGFDVLSAPWIVRVNYGMVICERMRLTDGVVIGPLRPIGGWGGERAGTMFPGRWGSRTQEVGSFSPMLFELRVWWFPFEVVLAVYGVVWVGWMVMWRWWMRRRWRASRVVEG